MVARSRTKHERRLDFPLTHMRLSNDLGDTYTISSTECAG